jgi:hypothetical protein
LPNEPFSFSWGPVSVAVLVVVASYIGLEVWRAWRNGGRQHLPRDFIALLMVTAFLGAALYALTAGETTQLDILIGALIGAVGAIVGFYFNVPPPPPPPDGGPK